MNRIPIIVILITALAGNALAGTITVTTDPPGLDISVDGEYLGKAPVSVEGPFGNTVKITVSGEGINEFNLITSPPEGDAEKVIEVDGERGTATSASGLLDTSMPVNRWLLIGLAVVAVAALMIYFFTSVQPEPEPL
ncbi:MAG: PEGA domain-containing protein [bacterium]|nr:PEGA domain-containing protein [bacterium]